MAAFQEHTHAHPAEEAEGGKLPAETVASNLVNEWEAQAAMALDDEDKPHLARTILDCLAQERAHRNEAEMLELIEAIIDAMDTITLRNDFVDREVREAVKRLGEQFDEYKSIRKI